MGACCKKGRSADNRATIKRTDVAAVDDVTANRYARSGERGRASSLVINSRPSPADTTSAIADKRSNSATTSSRAGAFLSKSESIIARRPRIALSDWIRFAPESCRLFASFLDEFPAEFRILQPLRRSIPRRFGGRLALCETGTARARKREREREREERGRSNPMCSGQRQPRSSLTMLPAEYRSLSDPNSAMEFEEMARHGIGSAGT